MRTAWHYGNVAPMRADAALARLRDVSHRSASHRCSARRNAPSRSPTLPTRRDLRETANGFAQVLVAAAGDGIALNVTISSTGRRRTCWTGRTDQIAEHHRQLPAFSIDSRWCFTGRRCHHGGRHLGDERGDSVEQSPSMADQSNAEILQILGGQSRQYSCIDLVVAERLFVPLQPETVEPCRYVHALLPGAVTPA
jgi:hypothetical protein